MPTGRQDARKVLLGQVLAEFLGTLVLIALGDGVVAMVVKLVPSVERCTEKG